MEKNIGQLKGEIISDYKALESKLQKFAGKMADKKGKDWMYKVSQIYDAQGQLEVSEGKLDDV